MKITAGDVKKIMYDIADAVEREKEYLSLLDRAVGDGDHGVSMSVGWQAIRGKIGEMDDRVECSEVFKAAGMSFLNAVGASVGPLYATAFIRAAACVQGKTEIDAVDIMNLLVAAVNGIKERGKAEVGDKTMIDTWVPAIEAMNEAKSSGQEPILCLEAAVASGKKGMEATAKMLSQKGRSSRLGSRSIGHQDPGATSGYLILSTFVKSLKEIRTRQI
ncbi:dihydroxyacetone kinase subunit DhaL [Brevibacillus choshinensis]|uniref:dihydroxyacetone kinase subunit DhaL n=1 Tax=Brevibacillus choshinensis TaxID=54911 RepID=UPI002E1A5D19|nr:dihydroxyacetone kinase subunit DhaL [Brevibacillus choshinensis]MED4781187.1 dihydroxyacetone kinase subunit DhaL [Brevibacillus choshinensis]